MKDENGKRIQPGILAVYFRDLELRKWLVMQAALCGRTVSDMVMQVLREYREKKGRGMRLETQSNCLMKQVKHKGLVTHTPLLYVVAGSVISIFEFTKIRRIV